MKHCPQCSREYPDKAKFCNQCGRPLAEGPLEPAVEKPSAPAAETIAPAEQISAPTIVAAVPAAIEIPISVPDNPVAPPAAVAVAEEPPASPAPTPPEAPAYTSPAPPVSAPPEAPAPQMENRRGGEKIGALRKVGAVFLCILLFLFLLIPMAAYQVRDASTKGWISSFLENVSMSDLGNVEGVEETIGEWLRGLDPELEDVELDLEEGSADIERFMDRVYVREFIAQQLASYTDDLYSGASGTAFLPEDVSELLAENSEAINKQLSEMVDDLFGPRSEIEIRLSRADRNDLAKRLIGLLEDSGVDGYLDTDTLKAETPVVYYGLRFGFSYITAGVSLILAAAIFICLLKTLKNGLRAANRAGIVLIVLGGLLTPLALFPKLFADLWLQLFQEVRVLAVFAEEFFYTHILADLIVLAVGILLTVGTGLALNMRKKRAAQ